MYMHMHVKESVAGEQTLELARERGVEARENESVSCRVDIRLRANRNAYIRLHGQVNSNSHGGL